MMSCQTRLVRGKEGQQPTDDLPGAVGSTSHSQSHIFITYG